MAISSSILFCLFIFLILGGICILGASLVTQTVKKKNQFAMQKIWVRWSWVWKIPWSREWQHTAVFLPGKFHGQRSLVGYSPWGRKESDTTERLTHTHMHTRSWFTLLYSRNHHSVVKQLYSNKNFSKVIPVLIMQSCPHLFILLLSICFIHSFAINKVNKVLI